MSKKKNWVVRMHCVVVKDVYLEKCTIEEAKHNPWDHATSEEEVCRVEWEIETIKDKDNEGSLRRWPLSR